MPQTRHPHPWRDAVEDPPLERVTVKYVNSFVQESPRNRCRGVKARHASFLLLRLSSREVKQAEGNLKRRGEESNHFNQGNTAKRLPSNQSASFYLVDLKEATGSSHVTLLSNIDNA